tara:strand:- start:257 stop:481 length:225 start_codon:yes stop_codon:yes gene_type:complete
MPETNKSESFVLKFNERLAFDNTGERVDLDELIDEDYLKEAKELKDGGETIRAITNKLNDKGYKVSKSSIQRKL